MPITLTPEQEKRKLEWIQKNGLDPKQFDYDVEADSFIPRTPSPEVQPSPDSGESNAGPSPLKTALKSAAFHTPEAAGGLTAAGLGMMAGAPLGPIGSAVGGIVGGFGGGALVSKAKDSLLEVPAIHALAEKLGMSPEQMAAEQQANPKAFLAGELGSNLPFFSVSGGIKGIGRALGATRSLALPTRMPAQDIAALANVGIGGALGAGQSIGADVIHGQPIDWGNAATQTAAGLLFNSPRKLGTVLSLNTMHPMPTDANAAMFDEAARLAQNTKPVGEPQAPAPEGIPTKDGIRFPTVSHEMSFDPNAKELAKLEAALKNPISGDFRVGDQTQGPPLPPKASGPQGPFKHFLSPWEAAQIEAARISGRPISEVPKVPEAPDIPMSPWKAAQLESLRAEQLATAEQQKASNEAANTKKQQQAQAEAERVAQQQQEQLAHMGEKPASENALRYTRIGDNLNRPESFDRTRYSPADPVSFTSEAPKETSQLPEGLVEATRYLGAKKYRAGVEVTDEPIILLHAQEGVPAGTPARGAMKPRSGPAEEAKILLSRRLGLPETPAHELIEGVISDLQTHGNKSERNFIARFADAFGGLDKAIDAAAGDFTGQLRDPKQGGMLDEWASFIRYKLGRASRQDMARMMANVLRRGAGADEVLAGKLGVHVKGQDDKRYSPIQEGTPEFKNWFANSKVTDETGKPLVLYHGTQKSGFTVFHPDSHFGTQEQAKNILEGKREYRDKVRQHYPEEKFPEYWEHTLTIGPRDSLYPVYLAIKNPKRVSDVGAHWEQVARQAEREGYDGLVYSNTEEGPGDSWVAFKPEQIKSATGNAGSFDPKNPDIRYSPATEKPSETSGTQYDQYFRQMREAVESAQPAEPPPARENPRRSPEQKLEDQRAGSQQHVNWRYSPASDRFGQVQDANKLNREGFTFFRPLTEKLAKSGNALKEHFAQKFIDLTNAQRSMWGGWMNGMLEARGKLSPDEWNNVYHTLVDEGRQHADLSSRLNPQELEAYKKIRAVYNEMGQNRQAAGQLVKRRPGGLDPHGMFEVIDHDVLRTILEHSDSPQAKKLRDEFIQHNVNNGIAQPEAEKRLNTLLGHFSEAADLGSNFSFNAVRTPEGVGLPDTWIEKDFDAAIRRYTRRFATDRAFFDTFEKDPRIMSALGANTMANGQPIPTAHAVPAEQRIGGDSAVRTLLQSYIGADLGHREPFHASLGRFVNSLILGGPVTKLTDLGSVPFHALRYIPTQHIPGLLASMANWKSGYLNAFKTGLNKRGGLIVATEVLGAHEQAARALDRAAEFVTKVTGSEQLELLSRGLAQSMGEFIGRTHREMALNGNKRSADFLKHLGSDWSTASNEELGTRIARLMQGRYDLTNLPPWMKNSPIAPFFSMMRWSVEQWNNFRNFAVQPAMQGNVMPLAHTLVGAMAGGTLLNAMRQELAGKKSYMATDEELAEGGPGANKERVYRWIAAANVTGAMGIVGELTRQLYDVTTGKTPQGLQYPVYGVLRDISLRGASALAAINDGEDPTTVAMQYAKDVAKGNIQIVRLAANALDRLSPESEGGKQLEYKNQRRDIAMFNSLKGYPANKSPKEFPDYAGISERAFDAEQDPRKAQEMSKILTQRAITNAGGDVSKLTANLRKLRTAPNITMPSPDQDPVRFNQYYQFIKRTQGEEKAKALLSNYFKTNAMREMKRDLIPDLSTR